MLLIPSAFPFPFSHPVLLPCGLMAPFAGLTVLIQALRHQELFHVQKSSKYLLTATSILETLYLKVRTHRFWPLDSILGAVKAHVNISINKM